MATIDGSLDGSGRADEIALMTDRDATIDIEVKNDGPGSHIEATTTKKPRVINRSSGGSRSLDATRRRRRF